MYSNRNIFSAKAIAVCALGVTFNAFALNIPSLSSSSSYDEFKTSSGMVCRQSLSGTAQIQIGGVAAQDNSTDNNRYTGGFDDGRYEKSESGVFAQIVIPIGQRNRIECKTLFDIEVEKQTLELQQLKAQIELLKKQAVLAGLKDLPEL